MKRTLAVLSAAVCLLMTGCSSDGGAENEWAPNIFTDATSTAEKTPGGQDISETVKDVRLTFAADYYLQGQDENLRTACKALIKGIGERQGIIDLSGLGITKEQLGQLITLTVACVPELAMIDTGFKYSTDSDGLVADCRLKYIYGESEQKRMDTELENAVDVIVGSTIDTDIFERLKSFHDAIVGKCSYKENAESPYTAYGCLCEGEAVCEGYSKAFMLLCEKSGIECIPVLGITPKDGGEAHMWNKIRVDDEWYNFDITWDDPVSDIGEDYIRYDYFGLTDEEIARDHTEESDGLMKYPSATKTDLNYFIKSGLYIDDVSKADTVFSAAISRKVFLSDKFVQVRCSDKQVYDEVLDYEFSSYSGNAHIFELLNRAALSASSGFDPSTYSLSKNEGSLTLTLILEL